MQETQATSMGLKRWFKLTRRQKLQVKIRMSYFLPVKLVKMSTGIDSTFFENDVTTLSKRFKCVHTLFDLVILLLGIYSEERIKNEEKTSVLPLAHLWVSLLTHGPFHPPCDSSSST